MKLFTFMLAAILLASCATSVPIIATTSSSQITQLAMFEPVSSIEYIEKGNRGVYNDSLSAESAELAKSIVREMQNLPPIEVISLQDSSLNMRLREELNTYISDLRNATPEKRINIFIPQSVEDVLRANGYRYGLIVYTEGFTRRKNNYGNQVAKDAGVSLGVTVALALVGVPLSYQQYSAKSRSTVSCFIIDAQEAKTVFYHQYPNSETEPLDPKKISKQLNIIFKDYFPE